VRTASALQHAQSHSLPKQVALALFFAKEASIRDDLDEVSLGQRPNCLGATNLVVGGDQITAGLAFPGRHGLLAVRGVQTPGDLEVGHEIRPFGLHVRGEGCRKLRLVRQAACKTNNVRFLHAATPETIVNWIQRGAMVIEATEEVAKVGRAYTKRTMPN
jgi:hypothetical protein